MVDDIESESSSPERNNFSRCMESATLSMLTSILGRKLTEDEQVAVQNTNRRVVPDRDVPASAEAIKRQVLLILNEVVSPHGYQAIPTDLSSSAQVEGHFTRGDRVLVLFPIRAGKDMHISHITHREGSLFYTNDQMVSFRVGNELDGVLKKTSAIYNNSFNSFVIRKPQRVPFPGKPS